jgi:hypothetical protein
MKVFFVLIMLFLSTGEVFAETTEYWLIQQDFIKMGRRDVYETQKVLQLKKQSHQVIGVSDLVDPEFLFLMPIKNLSELSQYPPFVSLEKEATLDSSVNFQIFSLHRLLEKASAQPEKTFSAEKPYYSYVIYEVEWEFSSILEGVMMKKAAAQKKGDSWCFWKSLLAGEYPKYVFCTSFKTKEEMNDWSMDSWLDEPGLKNILRDKDVGVMKREKDFCLPGLQETPAR